MRGLSLRSQVVLPAATLIAVAGLGSSSATLRAAICWPLLFVLPGWALLGAVDRAERPLLERAAFAVGLSFALAALCGFVLNGLGRLTPFGWAAGLASITLASWALSWWGGGPVRTSPPDRPAPPGIRVTGTNVLGLAVAACLAGLAVTYARQGALAQREYDYTEFWMVPAGSRDGRLVTLGIRNRESTETTYRIELVVDGDIVGRWSPFTLAPNETVTQEIPINLPAGPERRVEAWLFRAGAPERVYRKVWMPTRAEPDRRP